MAFWKKFGLGKPATTQGIPRNAVEPTSPKSPTAGLARALANFRADIEQSATTTSSKEVVLANFLPPFCKLFTNKEYAKDEQVPAADIRYLGNSVCERFITLTPQTLDEHSTSALFESLQSPEKCFWTLRALEILVKINPEAMHDILRQAHVPLTCLRFIQKFASSGSPTSSSEEDLNAVVTALVTILKQFFTLRSVVPTMEEESETKEFIENLIEILQTAPPRSSRWVECTVDILKPMLSAFPLARTTFRESGGFQSLISIILSLESTFESVKIVRALFECLICAISDDDANRAHVAWQSIEDGLRLTSVLQIPAGAAIVFGSLVAISLEEPTAIGLFEEGDSVGISATTEPSTPISSSPISTSLLASFSANSPIYNSLCKPTTTLRNPGNQVKTNIVGVLGILFNWLFNRQSCWFLDAEGDGDKKEKSWSRTVTPTKKCEEMVTLLAKRLMEVGVADSELRFLFANFDVRCDMNESRQLLLMELIHHGLVVGKSPCYLHLELNPTTSPNCFLEVSDFGRTFPPASGYTLAMWLRIEQFDVTADVPIFKMVDAEENLRLAVSVECKASRKMKVKTFKSTVKFEGFTFREREWCHVVLVHHKPKITNSSIDLFVNGVHIERVKCGYLGHPGSIPRIRTLVGAPPDSTGDIRPSCIWNIGPMYFIEEILLDATAIAAIASVGFDYASNWQGALEKYNTHESNSRGVLEGLNKGKERGGLNPLQLMRTQNTSTGVLGIPEEKILISLCAKNALEVRADQHKFEMFSSIATVSRALLPASRAFFNSATHQAVAGEPPNLIQSSASVLAVCPERMIDGIWKLGGCVILLMLVERSTTPDALYKSIAILVDSIRGNWRNTEEMERERFYEVLAFILKGKKALITIALMDVLSALVGRTLDNSNEAEIANASAFRDIFLDPELWKGSIDIQKYLLYLLSDFVIHSSNADANIKRLNKMHIIKRLLVILEADVMPLELLPEFVNLLRVLVKSGFTVEIVRSLCMLTMSNLPKDGDYTQTSFGNPLQLDPLTVALATSMFGRLWGSQDGAVAARFKEVLKPSSTKGRRIVYPEILRVVLAMAKRAVESSAAQRDGVDEYSNIGQVLMNFLKEMFVHTDHLRDAIARQETIDELSEMLYLIVFPELPMTIEAELSSLEISIDQDGSISKGSAANSPFFSGTKDANEWDISMSSSDLSEASTPIPPTPMTPKDYVMLALTPKRSSLAPGPSAAIASKPLLGLDIVLKRRKSYLSENKTLINLGKFSTLLVDRIYMGMFPNGPAILYDFITTLVEMISKEHEQGQLNRIILFGLGRLSNPSVSKCEDVVDFLNKCLMRQRVILSTNNTDVEFFRCLMHHLFEFLLDEREQIKKLAMNIWKLLLLQKPAQVSAILRSQKDLIEGFSRLLEMNATRVWDVYINGEYRASRDGLRQVQLKRVARLKKQYKASIAEDVAFTQSSAKARQWVAEVQKAEQNRFMRWKGDALATQSFIEAAWVAKAGILLEERALWGQEQGQDVRWKLDFTEGRFRMRKRFRRNTDPIDIYQSKSEKITMKHHRIRALRDGEASAGSPISPSLSPLIPGSPSISRSNSVDDRVEDLPVAQGAEARGGDDAVSTAAPEVAESEEDQEGAVETWEDLPDFDEEKNRKILRLLELGDTIVETFNSGRVLGLDVCEGLLLIYSIPEEDRNQYHAMLRAQNPGTKAAIGESRHSFRKWASTDIKEAHKRLHIFRSVAIEIFLLDGRNFLLTFADTRTRDAAYARLISKASLANNAGDGLGVAETGNIFQNVIFGGSPLAELTQKWCAREISTFGYLMHLNTLAGRSYNDLTQYPVFPWILADYESDEINLDDPSAYRDLSKPMGAQGSERAEQLQAKSEPDPPLKSYLEKFTERFGLWDDPALPACHYGTHYSSAMIVCSYLIRIEPFTAQYLKLQGGHFDHPDRLFQSIGKSWKSASQQATTDVRELIPEFFYLPQFLTNGNQFEFGTTQTGEVIDQVLLPPWAKGSPRLFIQKNREALESEYVSAHIHEWIDLIFGFKQQGEEAIKAVNVFHYLSYEGAVNIDAIADPIERQATIGIIQNFGQSETLERGIVGKYSESPRKAPKQLFKKPHPARNPPMVEPAYKLQKHADMLIQTATPLRVYSGQPIGEIRLQGEKILAAGKNSTMVPEGSKLVKWDFLDNSMRLCSIENAKLIGVFENMHVGHVCSAIFVNRSCLLTGGSDMVICGWEYIHGKRPDFKMEFCLRGHKGKVLALAASQVYSLIVSGGDDNCGIIWDLNRHKLWSINGDLLLCKVASSTLSDPILCCEIFEGRLNEVFESCLIFTGHRKGKCDPPGTVPGVFWDRLALHISKEASPC
ncbi:hypothetical protein BDK51DRAFT_29155 [Blyttiomyces helicus]|uniref:Beige protein homolog 1 n=1 Tax=Blyttiomyces helicus TaxID=388810 RepID=A0A4V1ISU5_9FUNG|nr:hypothetical protein BDK51DRAFT_29155 [Blyttiomyces helicus]|eukprot:RKO94777.1 hypothetical protein BDK51DRAFT_29155 [Blyttiomyces helicus]